MSETIAVWDASEWSGTETKTEEREFLRRDQQVIIRVLNSTGQSVNWSLALTHGQDDAGEWFTQSFSESVAAGASGGTAVNEVWDRFRVSVTPGLVPTTGQVRIIRMGGGAVDE